MKTEQRIDSPTISILGSGWLGLPLAEYFVQHGFQVNASTRKEQRLTEIESVAARPFTVDIGNLPENIQDFLDADILIINITSKDRHDFANLISEIGESSITKVLFVSSTSVYKNVNGIVSEASAAEDQDHPLFQIESLFQDSRQFQTTIIRFSGLIGYSRHPGRFFSKAKVVPHANAPVNLIHRDDCINIIARVIELSAWDTILNACASSHPTKAEFYTRARKDLSQPPLEYSNDGQFLFKEISNQKLKDELNYTFIHDDLMNLDF